MGGCVALQFAADYPASTSGLGLVDTTAWYGETAPKDWNGRAERGLAEGLAGLIDFQVTRWFSDGFRSAQPQIVQQCVDTFLRNDINAYAATCRMLGAFDGRAALPTVKVPTAVVVGEEDYAAPLAMAEVMHHGIAGSSLKVIAAARHLTPLETPDVIASELSRLLEA
jgi:3-oxoadipate enol-lactonase